MGPEPIDQVAGFGVDLQGDGLALALDHLGIHLVWREDPIKPIQGEKRVLLADAHVIEGAIGADRRVVDTAPLLDLAFNLLFTLSRLIGEQHMLGEVGQLLLAARIGVGADGQGDADRDQWIVR